MAITWDATWKNYAGKQQIVQGALDRIVELTTKAYLSIQRVKQDEQARLRYQFFFNDYGKTWEKDPGPYVEEEARMYKLVGLPRAREVVGLMYCRAAEQDETIYMSLVPTMAAFQDLAAADIPTGLRLEDAAAFVRLGRVKPGIPVVVFICPGFFTSTVYIPREKFNPYHPVLTPERSGTALILHEISHAVAGTKDICYSGDPEYEKVGPAGRAENADTYADYCQSFDQD